MQTKIAVFGWAQITKKKSCKERTSPLSLMEEVAILAQEKAKKRNFVDTIDAVLTVMPLSFNIPLLASKLAKQLRIKPRVTFNSGIGGHSPQHLVNKAAGMIARKEIKSALIIGAEAFYPKNGVKSSLFQGVSKSYSNDDIIGSSDLEKFYGISMPLEGFPLFEIALWAKSGLSFNEYSRKMGRLISSFSKIAYNHKYAWNRELKSVNSIVSESKENPIISFPYTKYMCPSISVDMGAAIILAIEKKDTNSGKAYFIGGGYSQDNQRFLVEKNDFTSSLPLKSAVKKSLIRSNLKLDDIECFDFYSCFPCAVFIAKEMLKIKKEDNRAFSLTGGLACFGGPGNNYSLHAIVTLVDMINKGIVSNGMITSLGWFMHKHAAGIYSQKPAYRDLSYDDLEDQENFLSGEPPIKINKKFTGEGIIETYAIQNRKNNQTVVVYGRTKDRTSRFIGFSTNKGIYSSLMKNNLIGRKIIVENIRNINLIHKIL